MKRNPRKLKWTKSFRKAAGKEMVIDSTLTFAARRNVPVRYDRELVSKTLTAMQRVEEIKSRREKRFYMQRMTRNKERQLESDKKLLQTHSHLLVKSRNAEQTTEKLVVETAEKIKLPILLKSKSRNRETLASSDTKMNLD